MKPTPVFLKPEDVMLGSRASASNAKVVAYSAEKGVMFSA